MRLKIASSKANPLVGRREVVFEVYEASTPSRLDVRRELAAAVKVDLDRVWVRRLVTRSGTHRSIGRAHVYEDAAAALRFEPKHIAARNAPKEKAEGG